jgi:asparaginyl-tRNA synthetase
MDDFTHASQVFSTNEGTRVRLHGWVIRKNRVGGVVFALIRDGTGYVQVSAKAGVTPKEALEQLRAVTRESAVVVVGSIKSDTRAPGGKEIAVSQFETLAKAATWPITKTAAKSTSYLYDIRHLSIRGRKTIATMKIRYEVIAAAFDFFRSAGFTLISAPTFVQAAVEGGSTLFGVEYFGKKVYLSQSAQFYEEASLPAFEKVWILQPAFRAEKSKTAKHLTEFWMIESEQAFTDQEDNLELQEQLLAFIAKRIVDNRDEELRTLGRKLTVPRLPLPRITYDEFRERARQKGYEFKWGDDIPTEAEREVSMSFDSPFFITDYPLSARSFYHMTYRDKPDVTRSADLIAPEGYGELATGGQRIAEYGELMQRITSQDLPTEAFAWYLELRKYGMPPHTGFGMGVERTTRWLGGLKHIRAASLFPRTVNRAYP